jgi:hypothetical protein
VTISQGYSPFIDPRLFVGLVTEKWSNGPVEGQVNRLKTIKRQMYGRAGVELLRARLIPLTVAPILLQQE